MLLGTWGASLLTLRGLFRAGKGMYRAGNNKCSCNQGQGMFRAGHGLKKKLLAPFHPLTNFGILDYFKDEPRFNGLYSRNNLSRLKNGAYVINLDHSKNTGTHWVVVFVKKNEVVYFDSFSVEYIHKEIMERIRNKNIKTNIFRIEDYNSIMCGYFCILFIEYMLNNKTLTDLLIYLVLGI